VSAAAVLCAVLHLAATCTALGGLFYARAVLWPNLARLPEAERGVFLEAMIRRFGYVKWAGIAVLAATGVIQWLLVWPSILDRRLYIAWFALKMVGAAGLLTITSLLALPDSRLEGMRRSRAFWSSANVACGLLILIGAALMRSVPRLPAR